MTERDAIDQLAALLDGDASAAGTSELGSLATLAGAVRDHAELLAPTDEFRASLRAELLAAADAPPGLVERTRTAWAARAAGLRASGRVAVATMTASSMLGTAGVAAAAQEALPGELLYPVKGVTEDARLLLASDGVAEARLHLAFARERLTELRATTGQLDTDQVVALLAEMDFHSEAGAEALLAAVAAGEVDPEELQAFAAGQRDGLVAVLDDLPLLARPVAEDSLELLRRIEVTAAGTAPVDDCDCDAPQDAGSIIARDGLTGPFASTLDVVAPGDGPAIPARDCDCIELPGGDAAREPTPIAPGPAPRDERTDDRGDDDAFAPTGTLTSPETDNDEDEDSLDTPTATGQLPVGDAVDAVEDATGAEPGTGPVDRLEDGVADLLD